MCGNCNECNDCESCVPPGALEDFLDRMAESLFGIRASEAWEKKICIRCKNPVNVENLETLDANEYSNSALCPSCFDELTKESE